MQDVNIIRATSNKRERSFTIRLYTNNKLTAKYRTTQMTMQEFVDAEGYNEPAWRDFLRWGNYYNVR